MIPLILPRRAEHGHATDPSCRDIEWFCALVMIAWASILTLPGDSFYSPTYSAFDRAEMGEEFWGALFAGVGIGRAVALYINGRSPRTPLFRMAGALVGFFAWAQLAVTLAIGSWGSMHNISPGVAVYTMFTLAEFRSLCRAGYDARYLR